jgi:hypothetical protein
MNTNLNAATDATGPLQQRAESPTDNSPGQTQPWVNKSKPIQALEGRKKIDALFERR